MDLTLKKSSFADAINNEDESKCYLVLTKYDGYQVLRPSLDIWDGSVAVVEHVMKNGEGIPFGYEDVVEVYVLPETKE